jgi:hypothetical protein
MPRPLRPVLTSRGVRRQLDDRCGIVSTGHWRGHGRGSQGCEVIAHPPTSWLIVGVRSGRIMESSGSRPRTKRENSGPSQQGSAGAEQTRTARIQQALAANQGAVVLGTIIGLTLIALVVLLF